MGFIRKRAGGQLAFVFSWKGKKHIKSLSTTDEDEAEQIRKDANEQLERIRKGRNALASKLLADGHSIMNVLFGSDKIAHLIERKTDDNPFSHYRRVRDDIRAFVETLPDSLKEPAECMGTKED